MHRVDQSDISMLVDDFESFCIDIDEKLLNKRHVKSFTMTEMMRKMMRKIGCCLQKHSVRIIAVCV